MNSDTTYLNRKNLRKSYITNTQLITDSFEETFGKKSTSKEREKLYNLSMPEICSEVFLLGPQKYGPIIEAAVRYKFGLSPTNIDNGNAKVKNNKYLEIKTSFNRQLSGARKTNFVQIRLHQKKTHYLLICADIKNNEGDFNVDYFYLSRAQMEYEVKRKPSFAHGTELSNKNNETFEMALRPNGTELARFKRLYKISETDLLKKLK